MKLNVEKVFTHAFTTLINISKSLWIDANVTECVEIDFRGL